MKTAHQKLPAAHKLFMRPEAHEFTSSKEIIMQVVKTKSMDIAVVVFACACTQVCMHACMNAAMHICITETYEHANVHLIACAAPSQAHCSIACCERSGLT